MQICTIIAKNYVSFARVLARSFREQHPDGTCWVLVIDDPDGYLDPAKEDFEVVTIPEVGIEDFDAMAARYTVLELSTAVKPWLLRHLLHERGVDRVTYLDPDMRLYGSIGDVDELLQANTAVLTPHVTAPMPRDGRTPSETDILTSGAFNLGFLGLARGEEADRLLDFWSVRLRTDCYVDRENGYFVDQRWMDFAPGLLGNFHVLRDPGVNVAYWNLPSRELRRAGEGYTVDGSPLRLFHFSGFDPEHRNALSRYQTRISLAAEPDLARLCSDYADELLAAGYVETRRWPYSWDELPNGVPLDDGARSAYVAAEAEDALERPVFSREGADEFVSYLREPARVGGDGGMTRYLAGLHEARPELREAFPDLRGLDAARLVDWARAFGPGEGGIPPELMPVGATTGNGRHEASGAARGAVRAGVNVAGYFKSVLGVGEVARQVVAALEAERIPVEPVGLTASRSPQEEEFDRELTSVRGKHPINLVCVNADAVEGFAKDIGPAFFADRYSIGLWWWEVSKFPERWAGSFEALDEVWAGTRHVADALALVSPVPVVKVTLPVSVPAFEPLDRARLGLPEGFLFMYVFDYLSVFERKNPLALVEAFKTAFEPGAGAALVIKSINGDELPDQRARLEAVAAEHPDVHLIDKHVTRAEKDAMIAACDCYVSLHRAEGFGITLAEAMWLGKPVIGTAYSGNLEFMNERNSWLVDYELEPIGAGAEPYPADGEWASPDVADAARAMRAVFDDPAAAEERARRGQAEIRAHHSPQAAGRELGERLLRVQREFAPGRRAGVSAPAPAVDSQALLDFIDAGAVQGSPHSRVAGLKGYFRRLVLRLIKPFSTHQREVDRRLVAAIGRLDTRGATLAAGTDELVAGVRALPDLDAPGLERREEPGVGVVLGYSGGGEGAPPPQRAGRAPAAPAQERRRRYLELVGDRRPVLDLGEGAADVDPIAALEQVADSELGAILAPGTVERLPHDRLVRLLELARAKLAPGGLLIAEAVNPHSPPALKTFWSDPARLTPIFPEVALELCRATGFESAYYFHPGGSGDIEADRYREGVYAVVAEKA